jgi:hypothetical protein
MLSFFCVIVELRFEIRHFVKQASTGFFFVLKRHQMLISLSFCIKKVLAIGGEILVYFKTQINPNIDHNNELSHFIQKTFLKKCFHCGLNLDQLYYDRK